jgi:hypothetical protein
MMKNSLKNEKSSRKRNVWTVLDTVLVDLCVPECLGSYLPVIDNFDQFWTVSARHGQIKYFLSNWWSKF